MEEFLVEEVVASSAVDSGIGCWDLHSGAEKLRYRTCASAPHGLVSVGGRFLAASQLRESSSASVFFWSWYKPQVEVKSFPAEPIGPLISNSEGTYIIGGAKSGTIYMWEVASGNLLNKWDAHYRSVSCLTLSKDESMLISGSDDGSVRVWCLIMMFDEIAKASAGKLYRYSFTEHSLRVIDVVSGNGLCNSIIISSSEDRTCKVWSLSEGTLLRSISFPTIVDAIAIDPAEHAFFAGGRDGKIYIAALNAEPDPNSTYGMFIIGSFYDNSKAITCLSLSTDGVTLVSGSEDGTVRVWNTKSKYLTRFLKHGKGPINNVLIVRHQLHVNAQAHISRKRLSLLMPPPLSKYMDSKDGEIDTTAVIRPSWHEPQDIRHNSSFMMKKHMEELQQQNSSGAEEMELAGLRVEQKKSIQVIQQWKKLYQDLQSLCVDEILNEAPHPEV